VSGFTILELLFNPKTSCSISSALIGFEVSIMEALSWFLAFDLDFDAG
jgi:hypothetical protein